MIQTWLKNLCVIALKEAPVIGKIMDVMERFNQNQKLGEIQSGINKQFELFGEFGKAIHHIQNNFLKP